MWLDLSLLQLEYPLFHTVNILIIIWLWSFISDPFYLVFFVCFLYLDRHSFEIFFLLWFSWKCFYAYGLSFFSFFYSNDSYCICSFYSIPESLHILFLVGFFPDFTFSLINLYIFFTLSSTFDTLCFLFQLTCSICETFHCFFLFYWLNTFISSFYFILACLWECYFFINSIFMTLFSLPHSAVYFCSLHSIVSSESLDTIIIDILKAFFFSNY